MARQPAMKPVKCRERQTSQVVLAAQGSIVYLEIQDPCDDASPGILVALGLAFAKLTLRLATGMTFVLLGLPIQRVPPGFFRVQLWIVMGLNTLAALLLAGGPDRRSAWWLTVAAAAVSYVACGHLAVRTAATGAAGDGTW